MPEQPTHNLAEIEGLLASRHQLTGWLERLDQAGLRAPEVVRAKVRADYQGRLTHVVEQLRAYSEQVATRLSGLRAHAGEYRQHRSEEVEIRAEAELRHSVGEYTDEEWQIIEGRCSGKIASFDLELARLGEDIRHMEEVLSLISAAGPAAAAPARHAEPAAEIAVSYGSAEVVPAEESDPLAEMAPPPLMLVKDEMPTPPPPEPIQPAPRPEAPKFTPRNPAPRQRESGPARAIPFPAPSPAPSQGDELAFLRSVSLDSAPPAARLTPHPAPNAAGMLDKDDRPSQAVAKTLKCGECGTLNRPTEWYCERCGAELAAL